MYFFFIWRQYYDRNSGKIQTEYTYDAKDYFGLVRDNFTKCLDVIRFIVSFFFFFFFGGAVGSSPFVKLLGIGNLFKDFVFPHLSQYLAFFTMLLYIVCSERRTLMLIEIAIFIIPGERGLPSEKSR